MDEKDSDLEELLSDDAYQILGEKDVILLSSEIFLRKRLLRWVVRTVIGAVLFSFLAWKFEWGKWLLFTWIPLAALSLLTILIGMYRIRKKGEQIETTVQSTRGPAD